MIKIKFLRKLVFIGEANGYTIYFDTENNIPMKAEKSKLLSTEKAYSSLKYLVPLFFGISLIGKVLYDFFNKYLSSSENISRIALFSAILGIFTFLFFSFLIDICLYKNIKSSEPATKQEFGIAIRTNNFWRNFPDKKVTTNKKIMAWFITILFVILSIASIVFFLEAITLENQIDIIKYGFISGIISFCAFLFICENNLIRWLNIVEKYQKRKLWRK